MVSLCLSNIFLHHVLDEWFENEMKPCLKGRSTLASLWVTDRGSARIVVGRAFDHEAKGGPPVRSPGSKAVPIQKPIVRGS